MNKLDIIRINKNTYRILEIDKQSIFVVNCDFLRMPFWIPISKLGEYESISENTFLIERDVKYPQLECISIKERKQIQDKYASICPVLAVLTDERDRGETITYLAEKSGLNRKTIIRRLYLFLVYQDIRIFSPVKKDKPIELTEDEKNYRYILNKYFYTREKRTLTNCYLYLLREKYSENGRIKDKHPSIHQFRHFYYKTRKLSSFYISREGRSEFDRNIRPLLSHTRDIFNTVGYGMVDSTTLDLYVLDDFGKPKRPILCAMVDSYSNLCLGYAVGFNGGKELLSNLILNVNTDKVDYCKKLGIEINSNVFPSVGLPQCIISDNGKDYTSSYFTQLTDLGIQIQTNKSHMANMKPNIERFFRTIQDLFKPYLFEFGVVNKNNYPDKPQRNAILNINEINVILCKSIIHYNSKRINNLPFGKEYLKPFSNEIFLDSYREHPETFIKVPNSVVRLTMMPRTNAAKFTRYGLKVGKLFYRCYGFIDDFLSGNKYETVAYDPENVSKVWLLREKFIEFTLVDSFFENKSQIEVEGILKANHDRKKEFADESNESEISLGKDIEQMVTRERNNQK